MKRLTLLIILLFTIPSVIGTMYCDLDGYVFDLNGNRVNSGLGIEITLIDGPSGNVTKIIATQTGPPLEQYPNYYSTSFTAAQCNGGETIQIRPITTPPSFITNTTVIADSKKSKDVIANITIEVEVPSPPGISPGAGAPPPIKECQLEGYVLNPDGTYAKNVNLTLTIKDRTYNIKTQTGPPPTFYSGYYLLALTGYLCDAEKIHIYAESKTDSIERDITFNSAVIILGTPKEIPVDVPQEEPIEEPVVEKPQPIEEKPVPVILKPIKEPKYKEGIEIILTLLIIIFILLAFIFINLRRNY